jgi:hypothetical protein
MKTITLIFIALFLFSCEGNIQVSTQPKEKPIGLRQQSDDLHKNVTEYTYGGCEYIRVGYGQSTWGSHKGNCTNPIHKKQKIIVVFISDIRCNMRMKGYSFF